MPDVNSFSGFGLGPTVFGRALDYVASQPHRAFSFIALSKSCKRITNTVFPKLLWLHKIVISSCWGSQQPNVVFLSICFFADCIVWGSFVCLFVSWFFLCHSGVLPIFASQAALKVCIWLCCTIWKYTSCGLALL